nr:hypothetical protein CFP56_28597 [Quercus suber]
MAAPLRDICVGFRGRKGGRGGPVEGCRPFDLARPLCTVLLTGLSKLCIPHAILVMLATLHLTASRGDSWPTGCRCRTQAVDPGLDAVLR